MAWRTRGGSGGSCFLGGAKVSPMALVFRCFGLYSRTSGSFYRLLMKRELWAVSISLQIEPERTSYILSVLCRLSRRSEQSVATILLSSTYVEMIRPSNGRTLIHSRRKTGTGSAVWRTSEITFTAEQTHSLRYGQYCSMAKLSFSPWMVSTPLPYTSLLPPRR